eukprot:389458-Prorocentrum_minimum.AAC.1
MDVRNVGNTRVLDFCAPHVLYNTEDAPEDAAGILHFNSGSEAHGRLDLTDTSPLPTVLTDGVRFLGGFERKADVPAGQVPRPAEAGVRALLPQHVQERVRRQPGELFAVRGLQRGAHDQLRGH